MSANELAHREIALVDLLDRLLAGGVVLTGDITLAIADIDLVHISLRALITSLGRSARNSALTSDARCRRAPPAAIALHRRPRAREATNACEMRSR